MYCTRAKSTFSSENISYMTDKLLLQPHASDTTRGANIYLKFSQGDYKEKARFIIEGNFRAFIRALISIEALGNFYLSTSWVE